MGKVLKALKFFLDNWKLIVPILIFFGFVGGTGYMATQKPLEQITRPLPIPEQPKPKVSVKPPEVVTRAEVPRETIDYSKVRQIATDVCEKINHEHENQYHFVR